MGVLYSGAMGLDLLEGGLDVGFLLGAPEYHGPWIMKVSVKQVPFSFQKVRHHH